MGIGGGQIGFDEGALFEVMAKPKRVKEVFKRDKNGNIKEKITTNFSYWDAVMLAGGPALIFAMVSSIKWIGQKVSDVMTDDEKAWYKDHYYLYLCLGPAGMKAAYEFVDQAEDQGEALAKVSAVGWKMYGRQIVENWGFGRDNWPIGQKNPAWEPVPESDVQQWKLVNTIQGGEYQGYQLKAWT
ncbi:unnamed protein product, partial [marine sediment metagenome]